jgi:phosphoribosyl 1,2-cyclic phosphodiesterase
MSPELAKLTFWGVRGSTPTADRSAWRYGGNTPCVELVLPGSPPVILDCGTGLRMLGKSWAAVSGDPIEAHIFVTHYHWDHIQGIPFFAPLYPSGNQFQFYSFRSEFLGNDSFRRVFEDQVAPPYFPVDLGAMTAARRFREIAGGDQFDLYGTRVSARWLNHPQGCLGFRFETSAGTIAYATDNEPGNTEMDRNLIALAEGADVFINDAQYTPEQLAVRRGWGHSSWLEGVRVARAAGVRNLILFHHDPDSTDTIVDGILRQTRAKFENTWAATEGMSITLDRRHASVKEPGPHPAQVSAGVAFSE